jgi:hypothetical protein
MITMIGVGIALLVVLAVVVGVVDAVQAPRHRLIAAERRQRWETRHDAGPHRLPRDSSATNDGETRPVGRLPLPPQPGPTVAPLLASSVLCGASGDGPA